MDAKLKWGNLINALNRVTNRLRSLKHNLHKHLIQSKYSQYFWEFRGRLFAGKERPIFLFFPSNDTHVEWMMPLYQRLHQSKFIVPGMKNENAKQFIRNYGIKSLTFHNGLVTGINPKVLVLGNDWNFEADQAIFEMKSLGGKSVVIQEGCLDFISGDRPRMQNADYAFMLGDYMKKYLNRDHLVVTGNPKFDNLEKSAMPVKNLVMINCNFTYNIFEDIRENWVNDVVLACKNLELDFFISQHPRDKGNFPKNWKVIKSNAAKIPDQIQSATIVISRFSTVIYEAIKMGRVVIYYNPHKENFGLFADDETGALFKANDLIGLQKIINEIVNGKISNQINCEEFLRLHCNVGVNQKSAAETIIENLWNVEMGGID